MTAIVVEVAGASDVGLLRERNEDVFLVADLTTGGFHNQGAHTLEVGERGVLLAVFDGMGGAMAGDRASALASEVLGREVLRAGARGREDLAESLARGLLDANRRIRLDGRRNPACRGMGTTATAAALLDGSLVLAHVGDSRAYLLRGGSMVQLTQDQSLFVQLVASGQIDAREAEQYEHSNVILQALGVTPALDPFFAEIPLRRGDLLLLCTDGLTAQVPEAQIARALEQGRGDLRGASAALTELARRHGGQDNATVLLAGFGGDGVAEAERPAPAVEVRPVVPARMARIRRRRALLNVAWLAFVGLLLLGALGALAALLVSCSGGAEAPWA